LTNQQAWNQYGIAIAGAVFPGDPLAPSSTRAGIVGLVMKI
jgi:hypothetical protein